MFQVSCLTYNRFLKSVFIKWLDKWKEGRKERREEGGIFIRQVVKLDLNGEEKWVSFYSALRKKREFQSLQKYLSFGDKNFSSG